MYLTQKGYTIAEILVAVGITSITTLAFTQVFSWYVNTTNNLTVALEREEDLSTGGHYVLNTLERAKNSFNVIVLDDEKGNNFFDFFPKVPLSCVTNLTEQRQIILNLKNNQEIFFLETDPDWKHTLIFDPTRIINDSGHCLDLTKVENTIQEVQKLIPITEGQPIANFNTHNNTTEVNQKGLKQCLDDYELIDFNHSQEKIKTTDQQKNIFYLFKIPEYLAPVASTKCELKSYFYLSKWTGSNFESVNFDGLINASHPLRFTNSNYESVNDLNYFIGKIPYTAGAASFFSVDRVRLVKYKLESIKIKGIDTAALYRYYMTEKEGADSSCLGNYCPEFKISVAQGVKEVKFRRPSVQSAIVSFDIIRDLNLSNEKNKTLTSPTTQSISE